MTKITWKPGTMIYPLPAVMVSCGSNHDNFNIITVSWTGTINTDPAMCYISVRPSRHSYQLIKSSGEFVINLTNASLAFATDWCGVRSGKDYNKFKEMNLTPLPANHVKAPLIKESPVNIECRVVEIKEYGTHHMFIAEVLCVHADKDLMNPKTGAFELFHSKPLIYSHGFYYQTGKRIGRFGFSVRKKKKKKR